MSYIFWGAVFSLLDFDLNFSAVKIGLLPDVLGWFLVMKGLRQLAADWECAAEGLEKLANISCVLIVLSAISYLTDLFGIKSVFLPVVFTILDIVIMLLGLFVWWQFTEEILRIEQAELLDLKGHFLQVTLEILILVQIAATVILYLLPISLLIVLSVAATWILVICFLAALYQVKEGMSL